MAELVYSVKEAAEALGVSAQAVYDLVHRADFPAFRVAGRWRVSRTMLAAWVEWEASKAVPDAQHSSAEHENCRPRF